MAGECVGIFGIALLYLLSIVGWGGLLLRLTGPSGSFWEDLALRVVVGCCSLYALFLTLSLFGRLHRIEVGVAVSAGTLLAAAEVPGLFRSAGAALEGVRIWDRVDRILLVVIGLCALLQIVFGLTPLMFYDLQAYLFLAPAEFLRSGTLNHILWNVQTNTPLAMPLIVGMSLALDASGQAAKLRFSRNSEIPRETSRRRRPGSGLQTPERRG